jgi:superoxide dismutase, Fe-Mn family
VIVSHYENNDGGTVKRLNAITAQLGSLDFSATPILVLKGLKREELIAMNSMVLHELYFDSLRADGEPGTALREALIRDFGSLHRWRTEFVAMGKAVRGGSGWVRLTYSHRDGKLVTSGRPITRSPWPIARRFALDMLEHSYHLGL